MTIDTMDWDGAYREDGFFEGPPPWNIGEPQPVIADLIRSGAFRSDVLDAGCGHGEVSLALAAAGCTVVGLELSDTAVTWAQRSAAQRGLLNVTFAQADITAFTGYDDRFSSVVDCTLFHALPVDKRDAYLCAPTKHSPPRPETKRREPLRTPPGDAQMVRFRPT